MSKKLENFHQTGNLKADVIAHDRQGDIVKSEYQFSQDLTPYLEQAKYDRENARMQRGHVKKFATIPDGVAIDIMNKYGINIHDPDTMHDQDKMKKFKYIIMTEYKHLMSY